MDKQIIKLDKEAVEEFIRKSVKSKGNASDELDESIVKVILQMIPIMGCYEEEGQKLKFKFVIGMGSGKEACQILQTYELDKSVDINDRVKRINKMIKDVAIFGSQYANILLVQQKQTVKCGIYFPDMFDIKGDDKRFLDKGYIIIEYLYKNKVVIKASDGKQIFVCMDFNEESSGEEAPLNEENADRIYRRWEGIFERVRRNVHGTICLIVDKKWSGDNNLSKYEPLNICMDLPGKYSTKQVEDFNNVLNMFITMLNYDGITVIDTEQNIRAYNLFCTINNREQTNGGARHYAYESLKKNRTQYYKAIYFQSQEGEIKFYRFDDGEELTFFDASIMCNQVDYNEYDNIDSEEIKERYMKIQQMEEDEEKEIVEKDTEAYEKVRELTSRLESVHKSLDNFYNEPESASALNEWIKNIDEDKFNDLIGNYPKLRRHLLNTVFICIIGNIFGYSWKAQNDLKEIMSVVSGNIYRKYLENSEYLDLDLLWPISIKTLNQRWNKEILLKIKEKNPEIIEDFEKKKYSEIAYQKMYNVLSKLDVN